jgi:hypothetical protein
VLSGVRDEDCATTKTVLVDFEELSFLQNVLLAMIKLQNKNNIYQFLRSNISMTLLKNLRRLGLAALFTCSLSPVVAHASVVTYDFSATIYKMKEWLPNIGYLDVASSVLPSVQVNMGNTVIGSFSYDTQAQFHDTIIPADTKMFVSAGKIGMNFTVVESGLSYVSEPNSAYVAIANNAPASADQDEFLIGTWNEIYPSPVYQNGHITLWDSSSTVFSGWTIPSTLSLTDFSQSFMSGTFHVEGGEMYFQAALNALTPHVANVPEPQTLLLMLLGVGMILSMAQGKQRGT